jgi:hypothetical protein
MGTYHDNMSYVLTIVDDLEEKLMREKDHDE